MGLIHPATQKEKKPFLNTMFNMVVHIYQKHPHYSQHIKQFRLAVYQTEHLNDQSRRLPTTCLVDGMARIAFVWIQ